MTNGPGAECSTIEPAPFHATTNAGLTRCARRWRQARRGRLELTLDGADITPPGYFVATSVFHFTIPRNNVLGLPGPTHGRGAYYGAVSILRPLSSGTHTLVCLESYTQPTAVYKMIYKLSTG